MGGARTGLTNILTQDGGAVDWECTTTPDLADGIGQVDAFLDVVAQEMDELIRENMGLKEEIKKLVSENETCRAKEQMINDTMVNCQRIVTALKANAEKEAENVVVSAGIEAERILADAGQRIACLREEILTLKKSKIQYETALRAMAESHLKMLEMGNQEEDDQ